jgi:hypothetical protein
MFIVPPNFKAERATPFAAWCGGLQLLELVTHHSTVAPAPAGAVLICIVQQQHKPSFQSESVLNTPDMFLCRLLQVAPEWLILCSITRLKDICTQHDVSWRDFGTTKTDVVGAVLSIRPQLKYEDLTKDTLKEMCNGARLAISGNKAALVRRMFSGSESDSESDSSADSGASAQGKNVVQHHHHHHYY